MPSPSGFFLIDKPVGPTSHDIVDRVRRLSGERRVGHAGTLDPFASGLLIVGVTRAATKQLQHLVGLDKSYEAEFVLGAQSDTDDRTGTITPSPLPNTIDKQQIQAALTEFVGNIEQRPPTYSAIKIGGKTMYKEARKGTPLTAKSRPVHIQRIELDHVTHEESVARIAVRIDCSSGTYIRAIARDLGQALGTNGYVDTLRRTRIGSISASSATPIDRLEMHHLIPVETLLRSLTTRGASDNVNVQ